MNRQGLVTLAIVVIAVLLIGSTAFSHSTEAKSKANYKAHIQVNFESDCWHKTVIKLNDGAFGKNLAKKTFKIDSESDKANDLRIDTTLKFDGMKVKRSQIQVVVTVSGNGGGFIEEGGIVQDFSRNQKSYNFVFDGFVPCN